jgi:GNAT superfamily N-acetyltransferase
MMFRDMGLLSEAETSLLRGASEDWITGLIVDGTYIGWILHHRDVVVGGGGMHIRTHGPVPGYFEAGTAAHIANVYIEPSHRRRGLAEALMKDMIEWARSHNIKELTLTASEQGRSLYRRLGFVPSPEFHTMKI